MRGCVLGLFFDFTSGLSTKLNSNGWRISSSTYTYRVMLSSINQNQFIDIPGKTLFQACPQSLYKLGPEKLDKTFKLIPENSLLNFKWNALELDKFKLLFAWAK